MNIPIITLSAVFAACFITRVLVSSPMFTASTTYYLLAVPDKVGQVFIVITGNMFPNYIMLAAPLLIFMVNVLNEGEVTDRLFSFCNGLLGRLKGGTVQVNIFISLIFSEMTGSAIADTSGIGLVEIEQMKKEGYDPKFGCVTTMASATIGPIFPPSILMVIYAMLSGALVGKLFMGGMVPGILLAVLPVIYVAYIPHKRNYSAGVVMTPRQFGKVIIIAFPALFTVILLLGGIYTGVCTSTEAGVIASAYALLISLLIYRTPGPKKLIGIIRKSVVNTTALVLLCGTSMLSPYIISLEQALAAVVTVVTGITDNKYIFPFVVDIVFLLLGCVLNVSTIQLVFVPAVLPLAKAFGIDLVHFGAVICLSMVIGPSIPSSGMLLFAVAGPRKTRVAGIVREILPMVLITIGLSFLITYVPDIILLTPNTSM